MTEHHFTDETATVIALNALVKDMHYVLDGIVTGLLLIAVLSGVFALTRALEREWFFVGLDLVIAAWWIYLANEAAKRANKYHPARGAARIHPVQTKHQS